MAKSYHFTTKAKETFEAATGVVTNCFKLNVRKEATTASDIMTVVTEGTKLMIDLDKSTASWYAIMFDDGKRGFVMKDFVKIKD